MVGGAQRNGGVAAIRQADDDVWICSATDLDDLNRLATEGMKGMGDGD